ncbi:U4/U6 small nuclear ribonucleoprotein Prp4-like [Dysidea avara]|uniref:U4/U6 small nuclear ribonucleoprotein Prp4-like n=1 Tax=Dysidea avara TaxID=196820 RepID=UPI00332DA9BD
MEEERKPKVQFNTTGPDEKKPRLKMGSFGSASSAAIMEGIQAGNINISDAPMVELDSQSTNRNNELMAELDRRKKIKSVVVPVDDLEVKTALRAHGQPACLFGERPADRRERLRQLLAALVEAGVKVDKKIEQAVAPVEEKIDESSIWYHEGSQELYIARYWIAEYSLPRARTRIAKQKEEEAKPPAEKAARLQELHKRLRVVTNSCSQVGDDRPISFCHFSPNSEMLATGSWSGLCKLWTVPDCEPIRVLRGHNDRVGAIVFHPQATLGLSETSLGLASCAADGSVYLWNLTSDTPIAELEGHSQRVSRLAYHPSGRFLGTACFDNSWRLWDLGTCGEVLHQEGHSRPVYNIAFHVDGSIVATSAMDGCGRLWDLRSGKCILLMDGHLSGVLGVDFSPNGVHLATGGDDHLVKVWDLRKAKCVYTIPAHTNLVSHLKYQVTDGNYLITASYDNTAKIWTHPGWAPIRTLAGHESKVMAVDISSNQQYIATASYDRTFKLWTSDES